MQLKIEQWGEGLALRIPVQLANQAAISQDTLVNVELREGELVVRPVARERVTLEKLLAGVTEENRHPEVDMGGPVGNEVW